MTVVDQTPSLTLGSLDLLGAIDPTYGFRIRATVDNFTFGDPAAVIALIQSQLQDGDLERVDRYGNRSASITLVIDAPNSSAPGEALARGAAAIDAACPVNGSWTTLTYTPTLFGAQTCVFDVTSATVSSTFDDVAEASAGIRLVTLTIHARPFARAATPTTIDAPATTGSTTTNIDSGSSTTGWSILTTPANTTNLCPNPSFETDAASWSASSPATSGTASIARTTLLGIGAAVGSAQLALTASGSTWFSNVSTAAIAASAARSYSVAVSAVGTAQASGVPMQFGLQIYWYSDAAGTTLISNTQAVAQAPLPSTQWTSFTGSATSPPGTQSMRLIPYATSGDGSNLGAAVAWWLDAVAVTSVRVGYFDGSTASTSARTHSWTGTTNDSTSTLTWTAPALSVSSGVLATVYGVGTTTTRTATSRRTGAITMSSLNYVHIKGTAKTSAGVVASSVSIADNGGAALSPVAYSLNSMTGAFDITILRPAGFTAVDVSATFAQSAIGTDDAVQLTVSSIDITNNPFAGYVLTRQVPIYGSRRTDLSLTVFGQDSSGTSSVALGTQTVVHTASAADGTAKFASARALAGRAGTADSTAVSGSYDTLGSTSSPTAFQFTSPSLLAGNYLILARIKAPSAVVGDLLSFHAKVLPSGVLPTVYDPVTAGWKTAPFTAVASGAVWPQVNTATWTIIPLGMLRLPPVNVTDPTAPIVIEIAKGSTAVTLDDLFLCNADVGQTSVVITGTATAVRLDAASTSSPQPACWVGDSKPTLNLIAAASLWYGEQHTADAGLLQISTVTPGCATTRVAASYYRRNHTYMASS